MHTFTHSFSFKPQSVWFIRVLALLLVCALPIVSAADQANQQPLPRQPLIQIAILLDTSSSMSGLINQSRNQLWQVVNEFARAKQNGKTPRLEVAVYEYGHSRLSAQNGYIRQVTALTDELDQVSEALFSLTTNGGDEFCGYVIKSAVNDLQWSQSNNDIKAIFIAGNEAFTQGPVAYQQAMELARHKGIVVNTIHAGDYQTGANTGWKDGALLAGGDYMSIDHNHTVAHIIAPQDKKLAELNAKLNQTYLPYGALGERKAKRQMAQDARSEQESIGLLAKRIKSKTSALYSNENWDLVDAVTAGRVDLDKIDNKHLPKAMRALNKAERQDYLEANARQRQAIKSEIQRLTVARDKYVSAKKRAAAEANVNTVDDAVISAVRKQGASKNFVF